MTPTPVIYRRHNCSRQHRTYRTFAKCVWSRAAWIAGNGPYAVVAYCRDTTVTLHPGIENARAAIQAIDATGCGGRCSRHHKLIHLVPGPVAEPADRTDRKEPVLPAKSTLTTPKIVNISVRKGNSGTDHRPAPSPDSGIVYVGDHCTQGGWNLRRHPLYNPWKVGRDGTRDQVIARYRTRLHSRPDLLAIAWDLRHAEALGCWCAPQPCHCDVILEAIELIAAGDLPETARTQEPGAST